MQIIIDLLSVFCQAFFGFIGVMGNLIWENLPTLLEIKKVIGYFSPVGMIALYFGVPTILVSSIILVIKRLVKNI